MRREEDGDIKPKKEDMLAAHKLISNVIELLGEDSEDAKQLINDIKDKSGLSNKAWDKTVKSLRKLGF